MSVAIQDACSELKVRMQVEIDSTFEHLPNGRAHHKCDLNLGLGGLWQASAAGEGPSKTAAKNAAWLHMLSKLHTAGILGQLFPQPNMHAAVQILNVDDTEIVEQDETDIAEQGYEEDEAAEPAVFDQKTIEEEKDAKRVIHGSTDLTSVRIVLIVQ